MSTFVIFPSEGFLYSTDVAPYFVEYVIVNVIINQIDHNQKSSPMILTVFMAMVLNSAF
jgi:hypothetical protein